jgi:histidinol-phosphate aminotransferase
LPKMQFSPKSPLLNPLLVRPGWQTSTPRDERLLWLDKNENLDPELQQLAAGIFRELAPVSLATYPEFGKLYQKLAHWVGVPPDFLMLTPGSDGVIRLTFEAFVAEGDIVLHTAPTFAMYPVYSQMFGATVQALEYRRTASGPSLEAEAVLSHLKAIRPRLLCLPNPDSPTGTVFSPDELRSIVELCEAIGTVVLIDEAYHPFYQPTCAGWTERFGNLIVARTFAKAWGLAGLRIGYAVGHPDTIRYLHKLRPMYEVSTVAAQMIERMLDFPDAMQASVRRLNDGKRFFLAEMSALRYEILHGEGNFLHVAFGAHAEQVHRALQERVLYRLDFKETCLRGFSRFSATTVERYAPVVELVKAATSSGVKS